MADRGVLNILNIKDATGVIGFKITGGGHPLTTDVGYTDTAVRHLGLSQSITIEPQDIEEAKIDGQPAPDYIGIDETVGSIKITATLQEVAEYNEDLSIILQGRNPFYYAAGTVDHLKMQKCRPLQGEIFIAIMPKDIGSDYSSVAKCECYHFTYCNIKRADYKREMKPLTQKQKNEIMFSAVALGDPNYDYAPYFYDILDAVDFMNDTTSAASKRFFKASKPFASLAF